MVAVFVTNETSLDRTPICCASSHAAEIGSNSTRAGMPRRQPVEPVPVRACGLAREGRQADEGQVHPIGWVAAGGYRSALQVVSREREERFGQPCC